MKTNGLLCSLKQLFSFFFRNTVLISKILIVSDFCAVLFCPLGTFALRKETEAA